MTMRTFLALPILLALALAPASGSGAVTVTLVVDHDPGPANGWTVACDVAVPAGANGEDVLAQAEADGCIGSYDLAYYDGYAFVDCIDGLCTVCPPPWAVCGYWSYHVNGVYAEQSVTETFPAEGDVLAFVYDLFPLSLLPPLA